MCREKGACKKFCIGSEEGIYKTEIGIYNLASVLQGGIAQLGERLHGMQEVSGSIPLTSTIRTSEVVLRSKAKQ
jgi:hypothetical protein